MKPGDRLAWLGRVVVFAPLFGILIAALWYAVRAWRTIEGPGMPASGYVAMSAGVILSLLVGVGLMSLLFYSRRHGYDDRAHGDEQDRRTE